MQSTEDRIGPYELHDFFLFHILRHGQPPSKVAFLAHGRRGRMPRPGLWPLDYPEALKREYDLPTIRKWLEVFLLPLLPAQPVQAHAPSPIRPRSRPAARSARAATGARRATAMRRRGWTS